MANLTILTDTPKDSIPIPCQDLKAIISCLFALIWLEEPRGKIFIIKAEELINKYQSKT